MKIINNTTEKLADDLRVTIKKRSRVSMAAACFSVYAFEELKAQLENLDELRFIFTSPAFLDEKPKKAQREFYIPRLNRERTLHGSEFEIKLRSEFRQRAISQECAHWIREKARFKSNKTMEGMTGFLTVDSDSPVAYAPVNGFTREDLGCDRGGRMFSMINRVDAPESKAYLELFDQLWNDQSHLKDVTDKVLESITTAYQENSPEFLYFYALYNIFGSFLEQVNEDDLPSEANGFKESQVWNKLYTFQKDAVIAIISKLEQYNGCILADSVGLGKTHLMHSIIWHIKKNDPNRNVIYLTAEQFVYKFVKALRYKDTAAFKEQFRSVDVLMVDDFQFMGNKGTSQEEIFHTFSSLVEEGKQVIISADKSPTDLDGI